MMKSLWKNIEIFNFCHLTSERDKAMKVANSIRERFFSDVERYKAKHLLKIADAMQFETKEEEDKYKLQAIEAFLKDSKTGSITELKKDYRHVKN